ncbi:Bcr/CflA family drug resistance efflux transporter [Devosia pacifica]|uniref:Bcr/CflA family efflux transporter n=1 Tax=Devosia pacifica TaxID=1335967 RepID=A0A918RX53_9HYPH|nr:multidrug effflux MFS transporter [Devosia pacifica]GHA14350.1 Bcr/CflA family drug resistance efflux transporter [Devosia pacifica]
MSSIAQRVVSRPEFIALIAAMMALNALAIDVMLPALPYMGEALGVADENERQFVVSVYMLGFGAAQIIIGPLSDRFGRRIPLLSGIAVYIAAVTAAIFAPNFATLLILRFVQGLGAAGTRVIAMSIVRDRYSGRDMAEVMSLTFMVFMTIPIVAPGIGQLLLLTGPWQAIFVFMGGLAFVFGTWMFIRLPETLAPENRREFRPEVILEGFKIVFTNRAAISYGLAGMFMFGALFGFISTSQQIYVGIYDLGSLFPVAFAAVAGLMAISSLINSRIVQRFGMRRISHLAVCVFTVVSGIWMTFAISGFIPLWLFLCFLGTVMFMFGWAAGNMNSLSMEPLGRVAGTASSVFGFIQTVGGALIGSFIGQQFNDTVVPTSAGYFCMGLAALTCILIAEKGRLFGVGEAYSQPDAVAEPH